MKKIGYLIILLLSFSCSGWAQETAPATPNSIFSLKKAFVTKQLTLTTEEAEKFWTVYYNYSSEMRMARMHRKEDVLELEENILLIRKKYKIDFKKILVTDDRVNKALTVDRDFMNEVKKELMLRQEKRRGKQQEVN